MQERFRSLLELLQKVVIVFERETSYLQLVMALRQRQRDSLEWERQLQAGGTAEEGGKEYHLLTSFRSHTSFWCKIQGRCLPQSHK